MTVSTAKKTAKKYVALAVVALWLLTVPAFAATHQISILGHGTVPDTSGEVFFEPYTVTDTAAVVDPLILVFNNSGTKDGVRGEFTIPQNYVGSPKIVIVWTANATSGTVVFDLAYLGRGGTEDMGTGADATSDTDSTTKSGATFAREVNEITPATASNFVAGQQMLFELFRDTITDTMAAKCLVFDVLFQYSDV